jgi:NTP pyrophosphatase (non-canonical NTP hydrolase)
MIELKDEEYSNIQTIFDRFKNNESDRNNLLLKAAEECSELSAELIQKVLAPTHQGNEEIEDEIGDVLFRLSLILPLYDNNRIYERVRSKINKAIKRI